MQRAAVSLTFLLLACAAVAQETYQKPPKEILDVLNAPVPPSLSLSPSRDYALATTSLRYPPIADLAQPMLRLAGLRINPNTNGPHTPSYVVSMSILKIADGSETKVVLPAGSKPATPEWSPDGKRFAFLNTAAAGIELWTGDVASAKARRLGAFYLNAAAGDAMRWMPDSRTLLVQLVPAGRGKPPEAPRAPKGPTIQESEGKGAPVWTLQDLLKNPQDELLFDYYTRSQLALIDSVTGHATPVGAPAIFQTASPSPDGKLLLVARIHRPYSYLYALYSFPKLVEIWDRSGKVVHKLADLPLAQPPVDGVPTGPRGYQWRPTDPATLVWVEALDEGNPKNKVPHRDRVLALQAPFTGSPTELVKLEQRFRGMQWLDTGGLALVSDFDRERRWNRTFLIDTAKPSEAPRLIWSLSARESYKDPGSPVSHALPSGHRAVLTRGGAIYLAGQGATPEGNRPFLDRFDLKTLQAERLFRSEANEYESPASLLDAAGTSLLTRRESPSDPPNHYVRTLGEKPGVRALTKFADPTPQLRRIRKQLVKYKRPDGVDLSFTLYLPPDYKEGARLPTVVWAYPLEYADATTAGQVVASPQRFTTIGGMSHLFFLLRGYAVLDNATMPVVGDFKTVNDTYIDQVVASAKAAIDKAAGMGVTDPDRVGVGGHSYGAFMTANLLAHSDLFRAGIARSGAYNRTLTPFGFQSERRTLWEAPETYLKMSPFMYAQKINEPILLIHGEADNNSGTFPIQSDRMYQAIRGNGGKVRFVLLPHESHGYAARESIEHVLYEMISWFDRYVKDAPPRGIEASSGSGR